MSHGDLDGEDFVKFKFKFHDVVPHICFRIVVLLGQLSPLIIIVLSHFFDVFFTLTTFLL